MRSKIFVRVFVVLFFAVIVISAIVVMILDPYFHFHAPWFGLKPVLENETFLVEEDYQNPGVATHFEYDSIIVGNSLSENFDAQWFNDAFGISTIKLTNSAASIDNAKINIEIAEKSKDNRLKYVFFGIANNLLDHTYNAPSRILPEYLYDDELSNDINYVLNKSALLDSAKLLVRNLTNTTGNMTKAYQWYIDDSEFSKENVLKSADLPDSFQPVSQKPVEVNENSINGIKVLAQLISDYPDTEFYISYSPLSIVYWYDIYKTGEVLSKIADLEYSMEQLLQYDNAHLFFPSTYEMITDLDNYKDSKHFNMDIQRLIFEQMRDGENQLTKDNYKQYIDEYREMILTYDYEKIFE